MIKYYVDSCIWLNLLNKEQARVQGLPVWKIAALFLEQKQGNLVISDFVIREVAHKNKQNPEVAIRIEQWAETISLGKSEKARARDIESKEDYALSFFDCMHIAISEKENFFLITRDKELLLRGRKYIEVFRPENLLYW